MKKIISIICTLILMVLLLAVTLLGYLTVDEYDPDEIESIELSPVIGNKLKEGEVVKLLCWNIGYGALGDNADFFMDGGKMVYTADEERVSYNLSGIMNTIDDMNPDILMVQEIDRNSSRSYFLDEVEYMKNNATSDVVKYQSVFAYNFMVSYIPLPIPPIGKVNAGIATFSKYDITEATRVKLPCPFKWPLSTINLKRCLEEMRLPIEDSDRELVLINLHLEAYDDGEGKIAQTKKLNDLIETEIAKGNYVIAGGDFNQTFSNIDISRYPVFEGNWEAGTIEVSDFNNTLQFITDTSVPTCRSLKNVYANADNKDSQSYQYYVIDGFIVSENIEVCNVKTIDTDFIYSDHNPLYLEVILK